jgi:hypothetical protein
MDWSDPNVYILFLGLLILLVPLYKRELLTQKRSFSILLKISISFLLIAIILDLLNIDKKCWGFFSFYFPIYIVFLYRFLRMLFYKIKKREPIDTAFDLKGITPWIDRIFNIVYFSLSMIVPMIYLIIRIQLNK